MTNDPSPYLSDDHDWIEKVAPSYRVRLDLEPADKFPPYEYMLVNLTSQFAQCDMTTFRMVRFGGPNAADITLRQNVCTIVGAITIAGGHIEAEMKRIIILAEEDRMSTFVDVDLTWTGLEQRLSRIAQSDEPIAGQVRDALDWAAKHQIKQVRDDAVHAAWCLYDIGNVSRSRFKRKENGYTQVGTLENIASHLPKMFEYANRLSGIGAWPTAVLPPLPALKPAALIKIDWVPLNVVADPEQAGTGQ